MAIELCGVALRGPVLNGSGTFDAIAARRYYLPTDQGYESTIAARMAARADARAAASAAGKMPRSRFPAPESSHHAGDGIMKTRETNRKKLAETEKRDAGTDGPGAHRDPDV